MVASICDECGAAYVEPGDSCAQRFDVLLALDHSRQEPWGSRHGLAFAVFALQHPRRFPADTFSRSFTLLSRVVEGGEPLHIVIRELRMRGGSADKADSAQRRAELPYPITIADLGDFSANEYARRLHDWCLATLAHLRGSSSSNEPAL